MTHSLARRLKPVSRLIHKCGFACDWWFYKVSAAGSFQIGLLMLATILA